MCGIFGYVGPRTCPALLIDALRRMEYRGYDSWGVVVGDRTGLRVTRRVGRIGNANSSEAGVPADGGLWGGIAHTRWATHGAPSVQNAHPHRDCSGRIAVVHNGIIENHAALRLELTRSGHRFTSDTDTEVIVHLVEEFVRGGRSPDDAFLDVLRLLEGAYGVAMVCADAPGAVYVGRCGSPIVIGLAAEETMVASDPAALVEHTREVVYLGDREVATLRAGRIDTYDLSARPVAKQVERIAFDLPAIERGGYAHFMLKEIYEQRESVRNAFRGRIVPGRAGVKLGGVRDELLVRARRCHILACGTSWHAGLIGKYLLENLGGLPTQVSYAAEFRYSDPMIEPGTLAVAISQSGETADTLAAVREAKRLGAEVMGICNVVGSSIARECGQGLYLHAGPEIGVASTKAFTSQLVVLALLAVRIGELRGGDAGARASHLEAIARLPELVSRVLDCNERVQEVAERLWDRRNFLYVGRLYEYPLALEGALKLKEISYVHAEGMQAAEMKHGPIALVDPEMPTVVLAAQSGVLAKMLGNVQEIRARGGRIVGVAREGDSSLAELSDDLISVPATPDALVPVVAAIPLQLLAYHIAVLRGCDVDHPRNLAKSVTVE
jgi:glucosamine--fructose-6-phosphate aminotransferase (isomerizing)